MALFGIDLGGTKIEGVVMKSADDAKPLARLRIPTETEKGYDHILNQIVRLVGELQTATGEKPLSVGVAHPGVLDPQKQTLKNSNTVCLNGMPVKRDLETRLGIKTAFANDANCFALAETLFGAAKGASSVFGVIMGTGVGGGIVINGKVLHGCQGIAGEWGHNFLSDTGGPCYCGRSGCVETVISGPALERAYQKLSGKKLSLEEIIQQQGEPQAAQIVSTLHQQFGRALATVINILDPEYVVLGGGVSNVDSLYTKGVEELRRHVFNDELHTRVVKNLLGDSAGVFGAALLSE